MKVIAKSDDYLMIVKDDVKTGGPINEFDRCRVYNTRTGVLAPDLPIGSWTARVGPWYPPTEDYTVIVEQVEAKVKAEQEM